MAFQSACMTKPTFKAVAGGTTELLCVLVPSYMQLCTPSNGWDLVAHAGPSKSVISAPNLEKPQISRGNPRRPSGSTDVAACIPDQCTLLGRRSGGSSSSPRLL